MRSKAWKVAWSSFDAVTALNTLQSNFAVIDAIKKTRGSLNTQAIPEMIEWCRRVGYEVCEHRHEEESAFVSSILGNYLPSPSQPNPLFQKIGLYTSPHLRFVRERIQINNEPLSEELFAKYFFETWDRLEESARQRGEPTDTTAKPSYFRFLTLMAFHTYVREEVDTAIIECGIGGEFDSTNIIIHPSVTGISSLGIDHVQILGSTIEEIAWHKAGIMKEGTLTFAVPQPATAQHVLEKRAKEKNVDLAVAAEHPLLSDIKLGLEALFQRSNASLAIALASAHLHALPNAPQISPSTLPQEFIRGLEQVRWPGRCETRRENGLAWYIDSAHTLESIQLAASWFATCISATLSQALPDGGDRSIRVLLFNQQTRDAPALARALHSTLVAALEKGQQPFTHVVFCTNRTFQEDGYRPDLVSLKTDTQEVDALAVQKGLRDAWSRLDGGASDVVVKSSIQEAVEWVRDVARNERAPKKDVSVLVTGSVHLVGGFLEVLESGKEIS
ncbi:MAG: hypothetical protein Q9174_004013 [Haloplaca sp. 1 TL-2023]